MPQAGNPEFLLVLAQQFISITGIAAIDLQVVSHNVGIVAIFPVSTFTIENRGTSF